MAATKCLVCGADLTGGTQPIAPVRSRSGGARGAEPRGGGGSGFALPSISLPLPAALAGLGLLIVLGLVLVLGANGILPSFTSAAPTSTAQPTSTAEATFTPAPTFTATQAPTATTLPPLEYTVQSGETVGGIAVAFNVTTQSILDLNGLSPTTPLQIGQVLQIPQPTPTLTPEPSATLEISEQTQVARPTHVVQEGETFGIIAQFFGVDETALAEVNNITDPDQIRVGQVLIIPIDRPARTGPTATPTAPPPYAAPQLLSPADGTAFSATDQEVALQWTAVDILQENEAYFVTVADVTCNCARELRLTTISNRLIVPADLRPLEAVPHVFKWTVVTARQIGVDSNGEPIFEPAGATSPERTFTWVGSGGAAAPAATATPTATPTP